MNADKRKRAKFIQYTECNLHNNPYNYLEDFSTLVRLVYPDLFGCVRYKKIKRLVSKRELERVIRVDIESFPTTYAMWLYIKNNEDQHDLWISLERL